MQDALKAEVKLLLTMLAGAGIGMFEAKKWVADHKDVLNAIRALEPVIRHAVTSGQIFHPACELTQADEDILCDYDVKIPIVDPDDDTKKIVLTANIFRSKSTEARGEKVPVVMCAHPYDNHKTSALNNTPMGGPPQQYRLIPQVGKPKFSDLTSWESPDPVFWVKAGYAVVNLNLPGFANSEGRPCKFQDYQSKCYYDAIEWAAKQEWCTGKVGLNGVSFLAITQYHVATCQAHDGKPPPSLCCISPWEGITDPYQDMYNRAGIPEIGFPAFWWTTEVIETINGTKEDFIKSEGTIPPLYLEKHPYYDDWWKEKSAKLDQITVPMLICGSFSDHGLHTTGSFRAWNKAQSEHKWLYTHRTGKWDSYYSNEVQELTRRFMDCFCKEDGDKDFLNSTPKVRLEVRKSRDEIHAIREENEWPLASTKYHKLYLGYTATLVKDVPTCINSEVTYPTSSHVEFVYKFDQDTELTGYMKLRLWMEVRPSEGFLHGSDKHPDDIGLFLSVLKLDHKGKRVPFYGSVGSKTDGVSRGWARASRRKLNVEESTDYNPVLMHDEDQLLSPQEIVCMDIALYPSSTFFEAGESLQLVVSAHDDICPNPPYIQDASFNRGVHVIHVGGKYDSHLLIPVVP